jgi:hypothetical protein
MDARIKSGHDEWVCIDIFDLPDKFSLSREANRLRVIAKSSPSSCRGRRERRVLQSHPQPYVRIKKARKLQSPQVRRNIPAFPARMVYGLVHALPGDRACCRRRLVRCASIVTKFDVSVETSGPHGFAVRDRRIRLVRRRVHRILCPTFSDDRETPLMRARDARRNARDLPDVTSDMPATD